MTLLETYNLSQANSGAMMGRTIAAIWKYAQYLVGAGDSAHQAWAHLALSNGPSYANQIWPVVILDANFGSAVTSYGANDDATGDATFQPVVEYACRQIFGLS